ncbi:hypothetical protein HMPREF9444_00801 [Succinatimonas hippei YIT 12066]|uniref:GP-PDE domain-containing protein n=1 Tax=Succinatimonas hippei (strain DSM 22608 / JCM 16073 / KCTC 15190 / YIT 12066) TaxID=762983 RepID=E8LJA2_SUCHY|nr:hypothetical protein HMPREF9444_00801 [Succinatimonas hippei YIT 12066]
MTLIFGYSIVTIVNAKTIIAHRGASSYLLEQTLEDKTLSYAMGVDFLKQELAMPKGDH